jgi:hypothetical protein
MSLFRLVLTKIWTRDSSILLGGFFVTVFLIAYIWWPLAEEALAYIDWNGPWWLYMDWLLVGIFLFMSLTIISRADLKTDGLIVFVGIFGGLAIESWGTQTDLWHYYTAERPPLWIIPAWPIASLSIDRITRFINLTVTFTKSFKRSPNFGVLGGRTSAQHPKIRLLFFECDIVKLITESDESSRRRKVGRLCTPSSNSFIGSPSHPSTH